MDIEKMMKTVKNVNDAIVVLSSESHGEPEDLHMINEDKTIKESKTIKDFLDAPDGAKAEKNLKKLLSAVVVVAKEKGLLPNIPESVPEMASTIDDSLVKVKADYQAGAGIISPEEAVDKVIDHATARVVDVIDSAFDSGKINKIVTEGIVKIAYMIPKIGPIVGPMVEAQRELISSVVSRVEQPVRNVIITGVKKVSSKSKEFAHTAIARVRNYAKEAGRKIGRKLFSLA